MEMPTIRVVATSLLPAFLILGGVSCGPAGPKLWPVIGSVKFDGTAPEGAMVVLQPAGTSVEGHPTGLVGKEGTFTLSTHPHGNGAPAGEYKVLVSWYPAEARQQEKARNRMPSRYEDPEKTPLPLVTIKEGTNRLDPFVVSSR